MTLRRTKSKKARAADALGTYVKLKTAGKTAKGARKAAKGTAAYQVAKRSPAKKLPVMAGVAAFVAAVVAFIAAKSRGGGEQPAAT